MNPLKRLRAIRTRNRTTSGSILFPIALLLGTIGIFMAPLVHIWFPKTNPEVEKYKEVLEAGEQQVLSDITALRSSYSNGKLTAVSYVEALHSLQDRLNYLSTRNKDLLARKVDSERIFDWKTTRVFLVGLGIRLPYLFFSILVSLLLFKLNIKDKNLNRVSFFLQISCFTISFYEIIWVFWNAQDYPLETYRVAILVACTLPALICFYALRHLFEKRRNYYRKLDGMIDFLIEIRNKDFKSLLKTAVKNDARNLEYQKELRKTSKEFEDKIYDKALEIMD